MSINLLQETMQALHEYSKDADDVLWIGSLDGKYAISFDEFFKIADFKYDNGYGGQEIAKDLVVVGKDWWLERYEYDGSECWVFKFKPVKVAGKPFTRLTHATWETLEEMQGGE